MLQGQDILWWVILTGCGEFISSTYSVFGSGYWFLMEGLGCDLGSIL